MHSGLNANADGAEIISGSESNSRMEKENDMHEMVNVLLRREQKKGFLGQRSAVQGANEYGNGEPDLDVLMSGA